MVTIDILLVNRLLNDPGNPATHPTGEELRKFYHKLNTDLFFKSTKAEKFEKSKRPGDVEIYKDAEKITKVLTTFVIAPLWNLYPAIGALNRGVGDGHNLNTPLDRKYLNHFGEEYNFSSLKGEVPRTMIGKIRQILIDIKPVCEQIITHYSSNPPNMDEAMNKTNELLTDHQQELLTLVDYCAGLSSAANIQPTLFTL